MEPISGKLLFFRAASFPSSQMFIVALVSIFSPGSRSFDSDDLFLSGKGKGAR
jgi:hypothetical protein